MNSQHVQRLENPASRPALPLLLTALLNSGCVAYVHHKFDDFYTRTAPRYYEPSEDPLMFMSSIDDADWTIQHYLTSQTLIGHLDFTGPETSSWQLYLYGRSIGADVIVVGVRLAEERTVEDTRTVYDTTTSTVYDSKGNSIGAVRTTTPRLEPYTYVVRRYDVQVNFYVRSTVPALWDLQREDVVADAPRKGGLDGLWTDGDYVLRFVSSGDKYLGFVENISEHKADEIKRAARKATGKPRLWWSNDDLKVVLDRKTLTGTWLAGDKTPNPCTFKLEKKTGYLNGTCPGVPSVTLERDVD